MGMQKISEKVLYYPHQPETDRPMLAYLKGEKIALAIDAGNSADHVNEFYEVLDAEGFKKPDFTVITHWHWDHTFGMHQIHGLSIAHKTTNDLLDKEKEKLLDRKCLTFMKEDNEYLAREYALGQEIVVVNSDIQFEGDLVFDLGGLTAKVFHVRAPHSEDTVLVYVSEEKILFLGDSTSEDYDNHGYMDFDKLKNLISVIESIDCKYCVLSHAEPLQKEELTNYLHSLLA